MTWYYTICAKKCQYYICWFDFMQLWMDKTDVLVFSVAGHGMCTCSDHNCKQCCSFRLMYCKLLFDVLCDLSVFDLSIFQHAYSTWMSLNGLRGWTGLHLRWTLGPWGGRLICKWRKYLVESIVHVKLSIFNYCLICYYLILHNTT